MRRTVAERCDQVAAGAGPRLGSGGEERIPVGGGVVGETPGGGRGVVQGAAGRPAGRACGEDVRALGAAERELQRDCFARLDRRCCWVCRGGLAEAAEVIDHRVAVRRSRDVSGAVVGSDRERVCADRRRVELGAAWQIALAAVHP